MPLHLSRDLGESFVIVLPDGREVWVELRKSWQGGARVVIDAPRDVVVLREEILEQYRPASPGGVDEDDVLKN